MTEGVVELSTQRYIDILEHFRALDQEMQVQTILTFLHVMDRPGITMGELVEHIGYSQASVSRNVAALSVQHRLNRPGAGLLDAREDPANRRQKRVWLTPEGQVFARQLGEMMQ